MRVLVLVAVALLLAACTEATASRIGERTFRIEGPSMGMISDAPNKRLAARVCPGGYRILTEESHKGGPDRAAYENTDAPVQIWTVRCI